jgi:hypothetical protein
MAGGCEHGNETFGSTKGGEFLYQLSDYLLLKKNDFFFQQMKTKSNANIPCC